MALQIVVVCDSIADLDVAGLTILGLNVPPDVTRLTPVMYPEPVDLLTDFSMERDSFGGGSVAKMTVTYQLHYRFLYSPIGEGRTGLERLGEMTAMVARVFDDVLAIDVFEGAIDIVPLAATEFGIVPDPVGNQYLGCRMAFEIKEYLN